MGYLITAETKTGNHQVHCGNYEMAVHLLAAFMNKVHEDDHLESLQRVAAIFGVAVEPTTPEEDEAAEARALEIVDKTADAEPETLQ